MSERCKTCGLEFYSGIWQAPQFSDEKVLLFCSEECKSRHIKKKLERIKLNYPYFYDKIMHSIKEGKRNSAIGQNLWEMVKDMKDEI